MAIIFISFILSAVVFVLLIIMMIIETKGYILHKKLNKCPYPANKNGDSFSGPINYGSLQYGPSSSLETIQGATGTGPVMSVMTGTSPISPRSYANINQEPPPLFWYDPYTSQMKAPDQVEPSRLGQMINKILGPDEPSKPAKSRFDLLKEAKK